MAVLLGGTQTALRSQLELEFKELQIKHTRYPAWYFMATYGKQTDTINIKINFFLNPDVWERLLSAEFWQNIHYILTNSLAVFLHGAPVDFILMWDLLP